MLRQLGRAGIIIAIVNLACSGDPRHRTPQDTSTVISPAESLGLASPPTDTGTGGANSGRGGADGESPGGERGGQAGVIDTAAHQGGRGSAGVSDTAPAVSAPGAGVSDTAPLHRSSPAARSAAASALGASSRINPRAGVVDTARQPK